MLLGHAEIAALALWCACLAKWAMGHGRKSKGCDVVEKGLFILSLWLFLPEDIYIKTYVDIHPQYHPQCHPINTIPIIPTLTISHPFNTNLPKKTWLSRELAHICVTDHATGVFNVRWMGFYMYMMLYIILFFVTHTYIYMYIWFLRLVTSLCLLYINALDIVTPYKHGGFLKWWLVVPLYFIHL